MISDLAIFGGNPIRTKPFPVWPKVTSEIKDSIVDTIKNEEWGVGSTTIDIFNNKFADMQDAKFSLAIHSGTSAIWICLKSAGIEAGDEVIIPAYTFIATSTAVVLANAVPVFADIDMETGNIEKALVEYNHSASFYPENPELKYWTAITLVGKGRLEEALPIFKDVFKEAPQLKILTPRMVPSGLLPDDRSTLDKILTAE